MRIQRLLHAVMILSLAALALASQPVEAQTLQQSSNYAPQAQPATDLTSLLQPDGTLKVPEGMEGSFNVDGWQMALDESGQPHFYPPQPLAASVLPEDKFWSQDFMLGVERIGYEYLSTVQSIAIYNNLVYVGGYFSQVGSIKANNIARWNITTSEWSALGSGTDSNVFALAANGNYVYAGGVFNKAGGVTTGPLARWDVTSQNWSSLGTLSYSPQSPRVNAIAVALNGDLYVGGLFYTIDSILVNNIAFRDASEWHSIGGGVTATSPTIAEVFAIAFGTGGLYAGGRFTNAGGYPASNLAQWNGVSWHAVGSGVGGSDTDYVAAIAVEEGMAANDIYVGGSFSEAYDGLGGTLPVSNVAQWDGSHWSNMGGGVTDSTYAVVSALVYLGGTVCVGGSFDHAGSSLASNVACWNGASWITIRESHDLLEGVDNRVAAMADNTDFLFLGGSFKNAGNYAANHITAFQFTMERWNGMGNSVNRTVNAVTISGGYIYVGGSFTTAGQVPRAYVARWSLTSGRWHIVGDGYEIHGCAGFICTPAVYSIFVNGNDVYIGGNFLSVGLLTVNGIARFSYADGDYKWHALGSGVACASPCGGTVRDIVLYGGEDYPSGIYAGGRFDTAGGVTANNVALWDGVKWNALADFTYYGTNGTVYALNPVTDVFNGDYLVVGGSFTSPYLGHPYLATWNGANWNSIGSSLNGPVYAIIGGVYQPFYILPIYVGGGFTPSHIAQLSGNSWVGLGAGVDKEVHALAFDGKGGLYAGGDFGYSSLETLTHIGYWDGDAWSPVGSGINGSVYSLAVTGKRVVAGGDFTTAGGKPSYFVAAWNKGVVYLPLVRK